MKLSRRAVARAVVGAPVALLTAPMAGLQSLLGWKETRAAEAAQEEPSPTPEQEPQDSALGRFLAREEEGLTGEERRKVRRQVAQLEASLKEIRAFSLTNDVAPSGTFRALRTRRTHDR
ncbi:MAG TPA: hypothetical protein VKF61_07790 [Candidatus Polarisedimenticolia bacterium]|nr:hypothetical protein [Candidatus Polarisedimenticolia bacterium]